MYCINAVFATQCIRTWAHWTFRWWQSKYTHMAECSPQSATEAEFNFPFEFSRGSAWWSGHDGNDGSSSIWFYILVPYANAMSTLRIQKALSQWKIATIFGREVNVTRSWKAVLFAACSHVKWMTRVLQARIHTHTHSKWLNEMASFWQFASEFIFSDRIRLCNVREESFACHRKYSNGLTNEQTMHVSSTLHSLVPETFIVW